MTKACVVRRGRSRGWSHLRTGVLIATFHRAAPARCGTFADERRVGGDDVGGRVRMLIQSHRL
jgi:hypothetical protein